MLEHIVYSCIFSHLNEQNILCKEQYGFQAGKSCETQLIITINDFANCLNENSQINCIFLDFSKVFDRVQHNRLYSRVNCHLHSFFLSAIRLWNNLDYESVNQSTLQQFKSNLLNHEL